MIYTTMIFVGGDGKEASNSDEVKERDLRGMTVDRLRAFLRGKGAPISGRKVKFCLGLLSFLAWLYFSFPSAGRTFGKSQSFVKEKLTSKFPSCELFSESAFFPKSVTERLFRWQQL